MKTRPSYRAIAEATGLPGNSGGDGGSASGGGSGGSGLEGLGNGSPGQSGANTGGDGRGWLRRRRGRRGRSHQFDCRTTYSVAGVGTISKFVTARLGFRACRAAAAKAALHTVQRC